METVLMPMTNFEFMRPKWPELADLCGFAEVYVHTDPASAMIKLRTFVESIVQRIYEENNLPREYNSSLNDLMSGDAFLAAVPPVIVQSFHLIQLKFQNTQEMIGLIRIEFDYYDLSDELLARSVFVEIIDEV